MVLLLIGAFAGFLLGIAVTCMLQLSGTVARREQEYFDSLEGKHANTTTGSGGRDGRQN